MRASDADREATVQHLQQALVRGLLTFEEAGERMTAAYTARYVADLGELTADLPAAPPPIPGNSGWAQPWGVAPAQTPVGLGGRLHRRPILLTLLATLAAMVTIMVGLLLLALGGIALHELLHVALR